MYQTRKLTEYTHMSKQECIPVGCVPPAHWSYFRISSYPTHAPPGSNHACPLPQEQPCTPPRSNHAHPLEQPRMPPRVTTHAPPQSNHTCPPPRSNHACPQSNHACPQSNHACPLGATMHTCPPGATMHAPLGATTHAPPEQPCMPPRATMHAPPEQPMPPLDRMTDTCKTITFANYVCGR